MAKKKVKSAKRPAAKAKAKPKTAKPAKKVSKKPVKIVVKKVVRKTVVTAATPKPTPKGLAPGYQWVNPYLTVRNVAASVNFYESALGFKCRGKMAGPDGNLMHAEVMHNDSPIMMGPESPGRAAPTGPQGINLFAYFENVDEVCARAAANGAKVLQQPRDEFWGDRVAIIADPDGHVWWLGTHVKDVKPEDMHP